MLGRSIFLVSLLLVLCLGATAQQGWQKFRMYDGKFGFHLPCSPRIDSSEVTNLGRASTLKTYGCRQNEIYYVAAFTDYPSTFNQKVAMDTAVSDFVRGFKGKVVSDKTFWSFSYTGREIWVRSLLGNTDRVAVYRFVFVGSRFYAMGVTKRADLPTEMENEKFFSSFALERTAG